MAMNAYTAASRTAGTGLFASKQLEAGVEIFRKRPQVAAVESQELSNVCSNCFVKATEVSPIEGGPITVKACTACREVSYCSKDCQREAWDRNHKGECKLLRTFPVHGYLPSAVRCLLQMMKIASVGNDNPFKDLECHLERILAAGGERMQHLKAMTQGVKNYTLTKMDLHLLEQFFALVFTNSLAVESLSTDSLGTCLDPFISRANHSCDPNAYAVFDGATCVFRSFKPIAKDEEIFIAYTDVTYPKLSRRQTLKAQYFFDCCCSRCVADTSPEPSGLCADSPNEVLEQAFKKLKEATSCIQRGDTTLQPVEEGLRICSQVQPLVESEQPLPALRLQAFSTLLERKEWTNGFIQGLKLYFLCHPLLYPQPWHPARISHTWTMMNLSSFLADEEKQLVKKDFPGIQFWCVPFIFLTEVRDVVDRSHGPKSRLAAETKITYELMVSKWKQEARLSTRWDQRLKEQREKLRGIAESANPVGLNWTSKR